MDKVDRSELWKRAYMDKEGRMEPAVLEIVRLIEKYQNEFKEGKLKNIGKMDILAKALGREKNKGRLQGIGKYLTTSTYYHYFTGEPYHPENRTPNLTPWESKIEAALEDLRNTINKTRPVKFDVGSSSHSNLHGPEDDERNEVMVGEAVAVEGGEEPDPRKDNDQVKKGKKRKKVGGEKVEKSLPDLPSRKSPRLNPRNEDKIQHEMLSEGHKFKQQTEGKVKKALNFDIPNLHMKKTEKNNNQVQLPQTSVRQTRGASDHLMQTTPVLRMFSLLVRMKLLDDAQTITWPMDDDVFGMPSKCFVSKQDCETLLKMGWAESSHIDSYSSMMFKSARNVWIRDPRRNVDVPMFSFIYSIMVFPKREGLFRKPKSPVTKRATELVEKRLVNTSKGWFVFMVYNPSHHWVLVVIDVSTMRVFYLDPMINGLPDPDLKELINISMTIFASEDGKKWVYETMVSYVKVPRQPGTNECGYYVMRFIRDIMEDINVLQNNFNGKQVYLQSEIDEVRDEWALGITSLIENGAI